jgi:6-pyruvoyltetrahydropterin/6-carboxytetrahydropterin synthase
MRVAKRIELDYGHVLPNYLGFCNQLHGHRAVVIAEFEGNIIPDGPKQGMVEDFALLKKIMMEEVHARLDHAFAVWRYDTDVVIHAYESSDGNHVDISTLDFVKARNDRVLVTELPPTAEYLAQWAFTVIQERLDRDKVSCVLYQVEWYETPNSVARCTRDGSWNIILGAQKDIPA